MSTLISSVRRNIRRQVNIFGRWKGLYKGYRIFKRTGESSDYGLQNIIGLYCETHGRSSDFLHSLLKMRHPAPPVSSAAGVLGTLTPAQIAEYVSTVERDGYCIFPAVLPEEFCDRLETFARAARAHPTMKDGPEWAVYDRSAPIAPTYALDEQDLVDNPAVQELLTDESLLAVARAYLKMEPILDAVSMWWSAPFGEASSAAAQLYHFDMDRIRWIKFFFYLTDVTTDTGPHCYVRGSNSAKNKPRELLDRGYVRITDDDMRKFYKAEDFVEICGKRGTIMAVDTSGFHKGKPLTADERLILQPEYTDSLFGGKYVRHTIDRKNHAPIYAAAERHPRVFSKFTKTD